jgi:hypothetical protein
VLERKGKLEEAKVAYQRALGIFNVLADRGGAREVQEALNRLAGDESSKP